MPGGNKKGPLGQGPLTGRGDGYCGGNESPGSETPGGRRGAGRGQGRGRRGGGGRASGGRSGRGIGAGRRGNGNQFRSTDVAGLQHETAAEQVADPPTDTTAEAQQDAPHEQQNELIALRELVTRLAQSVQDLEGRQQQPDKTSD